MPVEYKVPGVYIEELQPGSRPIAGVATAMPAFIGFTEKRPDGNTGQPVFVASWNQYVTQFGGFVDKFYTPNAIYGYFMNGGQSCYVQSLAIGADAERIAPLLTSLTILPTLSGKAALEVRSKLFGDASRNLAVRIDDVDNTSSGNSTTGDPNAKSSKAKGGAANPGAPDPNGTPNPELFSLVVLHDGKEIDTEKYPSLTMGEGNAATPNAVEALTRSAVLFIAERDKSGTALERRPQNGTYPLQAIYDKAIAQRDTFVGNVTDRTGLGAFEEVTDVTMMVCPDLMSAYMRSQGAKEDQLLLAGLQQELLAHCARMKDRFAILDAPPDMDVEAIRKYREDTANFDSSTGKYGALYYPWISITNPNAKNGKDRIIKIPPSGHIAGIYARVDTERGVHKAPANEAVRGALELERRLIDSEQAILNPIGVNCIRKFPGRGILVWGARTLAEESSEWRYINVRRLFNFVEESIYESTQWVVFEPNDMDTWERVKRTVTEFLTRVWRSGALFGATPEQAFYVKCDADLNTPEVRSAGQLIVEVGIAPVKPAEFVIFRFKQLPGGGGVEE